MVTAQKTGLPAPMVQQGSDNYKLSVSTQIVQVLIYETEQENRTTFNDSLTKFTTRGGSELYGQLEVH